MTQLTRKLLIIVLIITIYHGSMVVGQGGRIGFIVAKHNYWGVCAELYTIDFTDDQIYSYKFDDTMNCKKGEWIVDWDADDLGKARNRTDCLPVPSSQKSYDCSSCLCARDPPLPDCADIDGYYWQQVESNINENQVIVGLDFYSIIPYIGIKIALGTLLSNGKVDHNRSWKYGRDYSPPGKVCNRLSNNVRTFFLDDVILLAKYVVTGIRMVAIEKTAGRKGWKLQVKGTEYDSSFKLKSGTDQWFDYSNDSNSDMAYNRSRTEIGMETTTKITDTNHYIRIRATKLLFDNVPGGISYNEDKYHENKENLPLQGIELSYSAYPRFSGFVTMKLIPHKSLIFTPTTSPVGTTTETKIETTTEPPTTSPVETTTETKIETTTEPPTTSPVETTTETTIEATPRSSKTTVETL